ncbi:MAG: ABC transporter substrate-binding protein [Alphaproteobacteria bacterium]|nr:ABC transporter substrate-binding protein [Alphaproteobacteria bacterium]
MKKHIAFIFSALFLFAQSANAEVDAAGAENFVKNTTQEGIVEIINSNASQAERDARFEKLFNSALDVKFIGQFVLGRNWRTASAEQREKFIDVYRKLNVKTWSKRFDEFKGKEFIFKGTSPSSSDNQIFVNSVVPMENAQPASVVWRVKEKDGKFKIVDIIIENVSLAITARNEYSAFIKKSPDGLNGLIADLEKKIAQE